MNIEGQQLLLVSADEVVQNTARFGVRVCIEIAPFEQRGTFVARVVLTHALLPGRQQVMGLLVEEGDGPEVRLVVRSDPKAVQEDVARLLNSIAKSVRYVETPHSPASISVAKMTIQIDVKKHLH